MLYVVRKIRCRTKKNFSFSLGLLNSILFQSASKMNTSKENIVDYKIKSHAPKLLILIYTVNNWTV